MPKGLVDYLLSNKDAVVVCDYLINEFIQGEIGSPIYTVDTLAQAVNLPNRDVFDIVNELEDLCFIRGSFQIMRGEYVLRTFWLNAVHKKASWK